MKRPRTGPSTWHVTAGGRTLFRDAEDGERFLSSVRRSSERWRVPVLEHAILPHRYHLLVTAASARLGRFMKSVNQTYSRWRNRKYGLGGSPFDGPYAAFRQPTSAWARRSGEYIRSRPEAASREQVWEDRAKSLLESVRRSGTGLNPRAAAAWLARRGGVPLRSIARALGYASANYANVVIHRTSKRLRRGQARELEAVI